MGLARQVSMLAALNTIGSLALASSGRDIDAIRKEHQAAPEPIVRHHKSQRLNRSNKWPFARTYEEARALSPYPERPVR